MASEYLHEAQFYEKKENGGVRCALCRFRCSIPEGGRGICGVRENIGGILYTLVYGRAVAEHVDPIEKKPLFHVLPGSSTYSISTVGCNFRCLHCQNYSISQVGKGAEIAGRPVPPEDVVASAVASGCNSIAYTYTEPTVYLEYALETAKLARQEGLRNIFVTNGYITPEALDVVAPYLDAANIDLKGFSRRFYQEVVHATLDDVLEGIADYCRHGIWVEITTLVIPGHNDSEADFRGIASFIRDRCGAGTPWHVTGFYPTYRLTNVPPTPVEALQRAHVIGVEEGLHFIYAGNRPGTGGEDTVCPGCGETLIRRYGYRLREMRVAGGRCPSCSGAVPGIW